MPTPYLLRVRDLTLSDINEGRDWCDYLVYAESADEAQSRAVDQFIAVYVGDDRDDHSTIEVQDLTIR